MTGIPPLASGGLILSYRCTNTCAHCLYRCSPRRPDHWMAPDMQEEVLDALAREASLSDIHIAGGEPTLNMDCTVSVLEGCRARKLAGSYIETTGWWCTTVEKGVDHFRRLFEAGLRCALVSVSPYHNEFIPLRNTRACIAAAQRVFGARGVFPYMGHLDEAIGALPDDKPHTLLEFCLAHGMSADDSRLAELYHLIPACGRRLRQTGHFHVDLYGNLFTGSCPGIVAGRVGDFHPALDREHFPIWSTLSEEGAYGLMQMAQAGHGFVPDPVGYVSCCHLCLAVRLHLWSIGGYPELAPADFYADDATKPAKGAKPARM